MSEGGGDLGTWRQVAGQGSCVTSWNTMAAQDTWPWEVFLMSGSERGGEEAD